MLSSLWLSSERKVMIHALGVNMGGAMRHFTNFLPELGRQDQTNRYIVLVRDSFPALELPNSIQIERLLDPKVSGWLNRLCLDNVVIPWRLKKERFDLLITLTNFGPLKAPCPHILFQQNAIYFCPYFLERIRGRLKAEVLLRRRLVVEAMKRADLIITPSNAMAEMIKETCPEVMNRPFRTLYHGFTKASLQEPLDDKYFELFNSSGYKLLYPTHPAPHKGFEVLFDMLVVLKKDCPNFKLFTTISHDDWPEVVGRYEEQIAKLDLQDHVVFMGRVPQQQMGRLYELCDLMVYPSLCESFGFSMIEAMAHGLPVVAATTSINQEICGGGALYYDALDPLDGANALKKALTSDFTNTLCRDAQERLLPFDWSWKRYVGEFMGILEQVC